jgi:hypothetical protein
LRLGDHPVDFYRGTVGQVVIFAVKQFTGQDEGFPAYSLSLPSSKGTRINSPGLSLVTTPLLTSFLTKFLAFALFSARIF